MEEPHVVIAKFMGARVEPDPENEGRFQGYAACEDGEVRFSCSGDESFCLNMVFGRCKYDKSWNWLMPVIVKIRNTSNEGNLSLSTIKSDLYAFAGKGYLEKAYELAKTWIQRYYEERKFHGH